MGERGTCLGDSSGMGISKSPEQKAGGEGEGEDCKELEGGGRRLKYVWRVTDLGLVNLDRNMKGTPQL